MKMLCSKVLKISKKIYESCVMCVFAQNITDKIVSGLFLSYTIQQGYTLTQPIKSSRVCRKQQCIILLIMGGKWSIVEHLFWTILMEVGTTPRLFQAV